MHFVPHLSSTMFMMPDRSKTVLEHTLYAYLINRLAIDAKD